MIHVVLHKIWSMVLLDSPLGNDTDKKGLLCNNIHSINRVEILVVNINWKIHYHIMDEILTNPSVI